MRPCVPRLSSFALVFASLAAGCVGLLRRPDPPRVTVADVTLSSATLFEQRYAVRLRIQNPNPFALSLAGLDCSLIVNDQPFAAGVSSAPVTVPAYGTEVLNVDAYSSLREILGQFRRLGEGIPRELHYRLKGHVRLKSPALEVPFDHTGALLLGSEEPKRGI